MCHGPGCYSTAGPSHVRESLSARWCLSIPSRPVSGPSSRSRRAVRMRLYALRSRSSASGVRTQWRTTSTRRRLSFLSITSLLVALSHSPTVPRICRYPIHSVWSYVLASIVGRRAVVRWKAAALPRLRLLAVAGVHVRSGGAPGKIIRSGGLNQPHDLRSTVDSGRHTAPYPLRSAHPISADSHGLPVVVQGAKGWRPSRRWSLNLRHSLSAPPPPESPSVTGPYPAWLTSSAIQPEDSTHGQ